MNDDRFVDAMGKVLIAENRELRRLFPAEFITVDAIKAQTGWKPSLHDTAMSRFVGWEIVECGWCGDDFLKVRSKSTEACSQSCGAKLRAWKVRTGRCSL